MRFQYERREMDVSRRRILWFGGGIEGMLVIGVAE